MADRGVRVASGIAAGVVVIGVAEIVSVLISPDSTPLQAVGGWIIDHTPTGFREWIIGLVGTDDKLLLFICMGVVAFLLSALAGVLEQVRRPIGSALFVVFGVLSAIAALTRPESTWTWAFPSILGVIAGILLLRGLIERADRSADVTEFAVERRQLLRGIAIAIVVGGGVGLVGRVIGLRSRSVATERAEVTLPPPATPAPPVPAGADLRIPGLSSYVTPNSDFYRIDTELTVPQVSKDEWSLRIYGMVDREIHLKYSDLAARPALERLVTLTCVSNPVGGDLIGNASWLGYRLDDLLKEAGPHPDADMVLSRSVDGFTAGSPLAVLLDGRDAMLAVGMNGQPLPTEHGYPARLVVPGLYGYVSATKWVTELEVTRFDRAQAYWTERGWSPQGPIKTECRIDTPRAHGTYPAGTTLTIAGVAWAQHRGIKAVEVRIDQGGWQPARLAAEPSIDTWRQWAFDWEATGSGVHTVWVRATDGTGAVQTADVADVVPDGASGYPSLTVRVS